MNFLKHLLKKYCWFIVFYNKIWGHSITQNQHYIDSIKDAVNLPEKELNVFTKHNEDGILLYILAMTGSANKTFIDIGSHDCINSNCANLAFHFNWKGFFIDADPKVLFRGKYIYQNHFSNGDKLFSFTNTVITPENINRLLNDLHPGNEVDLLCIDLDGNDYFILDSITVIKPKIVVIEVQVEKGNTEYIPMYSKDYELYENNMSKGASPLSMLKLANQKGYELVAANKGVYNLFFVRKDCLGNLTPLSIELALKKALSE